MEKTAEKTMRIHEESGHQLTISGQHDNALSQHDREKQKAAIVEWKRKKAEQKLIMQQETAEQQRFKTELEKQERLLRQQELAKSLIARKQQQAREYQQQADEAERQAARKTACISVDTQQRIVTRNMQHCAKRQELRERQASLIEERSARLEQLQQEASVEFNRVAKDPKRILKATTAAQHRQLENASTNGHGNKSSGWIRHVQHRATPAWCRGG